MKFYAEYSMDLSKQEVLMIHEENNEVFKISSPDVKTVGEALYFVNRCLDDFKIARKPNTEAVGEFKS